MNSLRPPRRFKKYCSPGWLLIALLMFSSQERVFSQDVQNADQFSTWLILQAVPSFTLVSSHTQTSFGFEWEAAPLLYSFGMTKLVSPWHAFFVEPTARFTGSIELVLTGQTLTRKVGSSYFGGSIQLLGHVPLIERGEHLALNVGLAQYYFSHSTPLLKVIGISTLFGIVHLNLKQSSNPSIWIGSLELRIF